MKYDIPDEFKPFVSNVKRRCKANGIELVLSPSRSVVLTDTFSSDCSGYFDSGDKVLVVACGKPFDQWIEILVHEYSHMEQWMLDPRWEHWTDCCLALWDWMDRSKLMNNSQLNQVIDGMIELERDCEVRALNNIEKWNLPINKSRYKRKANLYLYCYRMMPELKKFPTGVYDNKHILEMCPPRMMKKYNKVPEQIREAILRIYS